ncbi:SDR family NAD(P)-dependent oxidoreductase [Vibrio pelagius]|uniref:SDR family NAD(P)-dependent oxidoreductase n=1 Tax=Vibrio pelagius TaxID=28169 RepID=UPI0021C2BB74|nr:SDR family NAD(P)-dependent oxidoreductase [Vibrio pelagius]
MNIKSVLRNIVTIKNFMVSLLRNGGVTYANIVQVNYDSRLKGKRIVVTGGTTGIGFFIAKKAIEEGAFVLITGRSIDNLEKAKNKIDSDRLFVLKWDVANLSLLDEKFDEVVRLLGGIDVLVNNAGVLVEQSFPRVKEEAWDKTYSVNSKAIYFLSQCISNYWISKKVKGKILNISSTSGFYGSVIPYGLTKWDVLGLTEGLAKALAPKGIIVNGIAPGRTATPMLNKSSDNNIYDSMTLPNRYGLPEEIAELAAFLISDSANFIVGQTIICDGGYILGK